MVLVVGMVRLAAITPPRIVPSPERTFDQMPHNRPIWEIAKEIRADWQSQGKGVSRTARLYLDAMDSLEGIKDMCWEDSASLVVSYFLSNARTWRGETARRVKKELLQMVAAARKERG